MGCLFRRIQGKVDLQGPARFGGASAPAGSVLGGAHWPMSYLNLRLPDVKDIMCRY